MAARGERRRRSSASVMAALGGLGTGAVEITSYGSLIFDSAFEEPWGRAVRLEVRDGDARALDFARWTRRFPQLDLVWEGGPRGVAWGALAPLDADASNVPVVSFCLESDEPFSLRLDFDVPIRIGTVDGVFVVQVSQGGRSIAVASPGSAQIDSEGLTLESLAGSSYRVEFTVGWHEAVSRPHRYALAFDSAREAAAFGWTRRAEMRRTAETAADWLDRGVVEPWLREAVRMQLETLATNSVWRQDGARWIHEIDRGLDRRERQDAAWHGSGAALAWFPEFERASIERARPRARERANWAFLAMRCGLMCDDWSWLSRMWPRIVRALSPLNPLPDEDVGVVYASVWLAALVLAGEAAEWLGDSEATLRFRAAAADGCRQYEAMIAEDLRSGLDTCLASQITGGWALGRMHALHLLACEIQTREATEHILDRCRTPFGLINGAGPESQPGSWLTQCWPGIEWAFASHLIDVGHVDRGLALAEQVANRVMLEGGTLDRIGVRGRHLRGLSVWHVMEAMVGLRTDLGRLWLDPVGMDDVCRCFAVPGGFGTVERRTVSGETRLRIEVVAGEVRFRHLVAGVLRPIHCCSAQLDGLPLPARACGEFVVVHVDGGASIPQGGCLELLGRA